MNQLSGFQKLRYNLGSAGFSILDNLFGIYFIFFLLPPAESGLPELVDNRVFFAGLTLIGAIIIFGRIVDSVADPLVAYLSDNSRSKLGRRRFFTATGALPFVLATVLLFFPPLRQVSTVNAVYELIILGLYFFFYTWFMAPYLALIPEYSVNHEDRIRMTLWQAAFSLLGAVVVMILLPVLWESLAAAGMGRTASFRSAVIAAAVAALILLILPSTIRETEFARSEPAGIGLAASLKMTIRNKTFIIYMIAVILYFFTFNMIRSVVAYYPVVVLGRGQDFQTVLMGALFGSAVLWFLMISLFSGKVSNKFFMASGLLSFSILMALTFFIDRFGESSGTAAVILMVLLGYPVSILLAVPNAMVADIGELDGYRNGINREAMFFGTQGFFMKINYGLAAALVSTLFSLFGKDAARPMGVKLSGPVGALFALLGFFVILRFPQESLSRDLKNGREAAGRHVSF